MPRSGQIIPSYLVPHVQTYINDNSMIVDTVYDAVETGVRMLCVFTSAKGEDGVIKTLTSASDYLDEYGTPNFNLYGQPCYMPYNALISGNAICHCLRVMPEDAAYSNVVICAYTKTITDPETNAPVFTVKFDAVSIEGLLDKEAIVTEMEKLALLPPEVDDSGYNIYPLFAVRAKGRGVYGDSFRIRIVADKIMNAENDYANFILEVLDASGKSLTLKEQYRGSFDVKSIVDNTSLLFDDLMGDPDTGSKYVCVISDSDMFENLYKAYVDAVGTYGDIKVPEFSDCDFFTGLTTNELPMANYELDVASPISLDTTIGISLSAGTDGSIAVGAEDRDTAIANLYLKAFGGEISPYVNSKRALPCELILDANYPLEVKMKLVELAIKRFDARCIIDAGILSTQGNILSWLNRPEIASIDSFVVSKECNNMKVRDPFTNKIINVTYTYKLANTLPTHYMVNGNQIPYVGEEYSLVTGHIRNSIKPEIDADNLELKEKLFKSRCNFLECIAEDRFIRGLQVTSQSATTDLSDENNVAVLLEMKRMLEEFVSARIYNFAEAEDRVRFTEAADRMFTDFRQTKVRSYEVYFDMNDWEESRSILHCYLAVTFRTMAKRGIIEIDINKRV